MKYFYALSFLLSLAVVNADGETNEAYDTKNDGVDMEAVVRDVKLLGPIVDCINEQVKVCHPLGIEFKKDLPDAIRTNCVKCNDIQKSLFRILLQGIKDGLPDKFEVLKKKFDPDGKYFIAVEAT